MMFGLVMGFVGAASAGWEFRDKLMQFWNGSAKKHLQNVKDKFPKFGM